MNLLIAGRPYPLQGLADTGTPNHVQVNTTIGGKAKTLIVSVCEIANYNPQKQYKPGVLVLDDGETLADLAMVQRPVVSPRPTGTTGSQPAQQGPTVTVINPGTKANNAHKLTPSAPVPGHIREDFDQITSKLIQDYHGGDASSSCLTTPRGIQVDYTPLGVITAIRGAGKMSMGDLFAEMRNGVNYVHAVGLGHLTKYIRQNRGGPSSNDAEVVDTASEDVMLDLDGASTAPPDPPDTDGAPDPDVTD